MGERLCEVFKNPTGMVIMLVVFAGDIHEPWVAGALFVAVGLICWPGTKRFAGQLWLRRADGRIHAVDYFALIAVLGLMAAGGVKAIDSLDLECWVRSGHLLGPDCDDASSSFSR